MANKLGKVLIGTEAERPSSSSEMTGTLFVATDTNKLYRNTGAAWQEVGGGSGTVEPVGPNEIRNFPSLEKADDAQPEWWEEADANCTLTEVDLAGEAGITEKYDRALKVVVASANSYAYQLFTYADEPRLKAGKTYSVAVDVWSVAGVAARVRLQSSVGSLGVSSDTTAAAWTQKTVTGVALDGTTIALRLEVDVGTAYFVPLGLVEGSVAPTVQMRPRGLKYQRLTAGVEVEDLAASTGKAFADVDLTSATSPLAVLFDLFINMFEGTSGEEYDYFTRMNGSSAAADVTTKRGNVRGQRNDAHTNSFTELGDDGQIIETQLTRAAGTGSIAVCELVVCGWWEWE